MLLSPPGSYRLPRRSAIRFGVPEVVPSQSLRAHGANNPTTLGAPAPDAYRLTGAAACPALTRANYMPSLILAEAGK
jgi:hypothetical protein